MTEPALLAELWRGEILEGRHFGHAVVVDDTGAVVEAWGDPDRIILPRSSCKMLQALPLLESGAADAAALTSEHLALACASHQGAAIHTDRVQRWLSDVGLTEADLRCGPQRPSDRPARERLRAAGTAPDQTHNNCSGKHAGFLTLGAHLKAGPEYIDPAHPVQTGVRQAFEEMTGETAPGFGIDGCSAPNFATSVTGLARAMARMAAPDTLTGLRAKSAARLVEAMAAHPLLVAGEGRACSELIAAADGQAVVKTGAEGVFAAILPGKRLGIALKVEDGATRASEAAMAALLVRHGLLARDHPMITKRTRAIELNRRGIAAAELRAADGLF